MKITELCRNYVVKYCPPLYLHSHVDTVWESYKSLPTNWPKNIGEIILARLWCESDRSEQKVDTGIEREGGWALRLKWLHQVAFSDHSVATGCAGQGGHLFKIEIFKPLISSCLAQCFSIHDTKLAPPTNSVAIGPLYVHCKVDVASLATFESGSCFISDSKLDLNNSLATVEQGRSCNPIKANT